MKRTSLLWVFAAGLLMSAVAQAQQRSNGGESPLQILPLLDRLNGQAGGAPPVLFRLLNSPGGAWWTNKALVERLGLTDDQKTRIERAFENHRSNIESNQKALEKEEAQLAKLLAADTVDRGAVLSQIDRVTQARSELERTNSVMTLEMREVLNKTQWSQLPQTTLGYTVGYLTQGNRLEFSVTAPAGQRGGGGRGQRQ